MYIYISPYFHIYNIFINLYHKKSIISFSFLGRGGRGFKISHKFGKQIKNKGFKTNIHEINKWIIQNK